MLDSRFSSGMGQQMLDDCTLILDYFEKNIGKPDDSLPTFRDMFEQRHELFEGTDKSPTLEAFRAKLRLRFSKIVAKAELFDVGLYSFDGIRRSYLGLPSDGDEKPGTALRFGIERAHNKAKVPELIGRQALASLTCFQSIMEDMCMPSISDLPEIIENLVDFFGIPDSDKGFRNPYLSSRKDFDRIPAEFLLFRPDGRSRARIMEQDVASETRRKTWYQQYFEIALNCFLHKEMLKVNYQSASGSDKLSIFDPIICTVLVKNGAVYLIGVLWDVSKNAYELNESKTFYKVQTYKMDRIIDCKPAGIKSVLPREDVTRISSQVTTNDGAFFVPPENRINAIIKVSPRYPYYEETVPFLSECAGERLPPEKLAAIGQPAGAKCYLVKQTSLEHLTNEVIKARGNIVVISPANVVDEVRREMAMVLDCQFLCEPKGIANFETIGYNRIPNAESLSRIGDLPEFIPSGVE